MSFLMASSSSLTPVRRYHVFPSFHGQDVRKRFLSHVHNYFASKGIITFNDQEIVRGHTIGPELVQAIRESRVSIVVLSKNYASSSWCLDELVEILKCEEDIGQSVMTIFYDVDPSDVRKQIGNFGKAFEKTCEGKTEEVKQRWREALEHVATIAGEHSLNWADEAEMIQTIAKDVSKKLNVTPSRDFEGMVGLEAHLNKLNSLLWLGCDDVVKMIGIWGPAGIGKTTIARALYSQLSTSFQLKCFMGNLKESCKSLMVSDDYDFKLWLQSQLLSNILNQKDMKVHHLGAIKEWLQDQRVLIILDDIDHVEQLKALAKEFSWFGSGSRIIITTEDKKTLKAHEIHDIYYVGFPSREEALEILCLSAFKQSSVKKGFEEHANKVAWFCGYLPLGLRVVGSSLCGESKEEWENQLSRIESNVDREIEDVLRVGYDRLSKKNQSLFLHIACFFNYSYAKYVISMLSGSNLDVRNGLKTLADKCLVDISPPSIRIHHHLLQQLGRQIVLEQSNEPGKRQFLVEEEEVIEVLRNGTGTGSVIGIYKDRGQTISIDKREMDEVSISKRAFEGMPNLQFLRLYKNMGESALQIPEDMEYLPRLKLLDWNYYPRESLPPKFQPDCLVELHMRDSNLKKLWGGIQPLSNLKTIDLSGSDRLKEIPDLSKATNLETLNLGFCKILNKISDLSKATNLETLNIGFCKSLKKIPDLSKATNLKTLDIHWCKSLKTISDLSKATNLKTLDFQFCKSLKKISDLSKATNLETLRLGFCTSLKQIPNLSKATNLKTLDLRACRILVELPSYISNLHKLERLDVGFCENLKVIPANINLTSLEEVDMSYCLQLRNFPDISTNIKNLNVSHTMIEDVPPSIVECWSRLQCLQIGSKSLNRLSHAPLSITVLNLSTSDIKSIPDCVISLPYLVHLSVNNCPNLMSIPALSSSLKSLNANNCVSLKRVCCSLQNPTEKLSFSNCLKLDEESRRRIIQQSIVMYGYICLPGKEIPTEFTHKAKGDSVTISLASGTFSASSRFRACFMILPLEGYKHLTIRCHLRSEGGRTYHKNIVVRLSDLSHWSEHLFIYHGGLSDQINSCHVTMSEITFEFSCIYFDGFRGGELSNTTTTTANFGVQIMTEEADGSLSEVDSYQIRGNNSHHTDGDGDEDGNYEAEDVKFSQVENIKTSKHTGRWNWRRKLGLKEKKMNMTE